MRLRELARSEINRAFTGIKRSVPFDLGRHIVRSSPTTAGFDFSSNAGLLAGLDQNDRKILQAELLRHEDGNFARITWDRSGFLLLRLSEAAIGSGFASLAEACENIDAGTVCTGDRPDLPINRLVQECLALWGLANESRFDIYTLQEMPPLLDALNTTSHSFIQEGLDAAQAAGETNRRLLLAANELAHSLKDGPGSADTIRATGELASLLGQMRAAESIIGPTCGITLMRLKLIEIGGKLLQSAEYRMRSKK